MESQPLNLEFKNYPENFHHCVHCNYIYLDCSHYQLTVSALLSALGLALLSCLVHWVFINQRSFHSYNLSNSAF